MSGARKDRAERDSDILSRVRPLNLIRIMPAEEECAKRPSGIETAFFNSKVQSSEFKVPGFVFRAAGVRKNKD
jgi:hypothetical protein